MNTSNRDRIPLSDIMSAGNKKYNLQIGKKNTDRKVRHVKEFSGRLKTFCKITGRRMSA